MKFKGNRIDQKGAFFGCGGSDESLQRASIQSLSDLKKIKPKDYYGLYTNINGAESKISETCCLSPGDTVGLRFDRKRGSVAFDLNGVDFGEVHRFNSKPNLMLYPTVDLGMSGDFVRIRHVSELCDLAEAQFVTPLLVNNADRLSSILRKDVGCLPQDQQEMFTTLVSLMLLNDVPLIELIQAMEENDLRPDTYLEFLETKYKTETVNKEKQ